MAFVKVAAPLMLAVLTGGVNPVALTAILPVTVPPVVLVACRNEVLRMLRGGPERRLLRGSYQLDATEGHRGDIYHAGSRIGVNQRRPESAPGIVVGDTKGATTDSARQEQRRLCRLRRSQRHEGHYRYYE